jgi:hypothetical protein
MRTDTLGLVIELGSAHTSELDLEVGLNYKKGFMELAFQFRLTNYLL